MRYGKATFQRVQAPLFTNMARAEEWYARNTLGDFVIHPRTDGLCAVFDRRRAWNDQVIAVERTEADAQKTMKAAHAKAIACKYAPTKQS